MSTVVVSVRIPKHLKEEAERLGVNIRQVIEESLRRAIEEEKRRRVMEALRELAEACEGLSEDEWVNVIKAARWGRTLDNT